VSDGTRTPEFLPPLTSRAAVHEVTEAFTLRFGSGPDGVWSAPGRVNLIGEHVDYNDGLCLPVALPHRTFVAARPRDDGLVRLASRQSDEPWEGHLDDVGPGAVDGWAAYAAGVLWALREDDVDVPGMDLAVDGGVPLGAGLSSSAALECAVAVAVAEAAGLADDDAGRRRLAAACVRAENEVAGAPTGGMDQAVALLATAEHALLLDSRDGSTEQIPLPLNRSGLSLVVIDTRAPHRLVDGQYGSRRAACADAAAALGVASLREVADAADPGAALAGLTDDVLRRRARHVVTEIGRVRSVADLLRTGEVAEIGALLDASHASLRDDYEVSSPELDVAVEAARSAGARGARMTGGGFGGSAVALTPSVLVDEVAATVLDAFRDSGFDDPAFLVAVPSSAAHRDT
jgi:galactokinase